MGVIEEIDKLDIPDEAKAKLKAEHNAEMRPSRLAGLKSDAESVVSRFRDMGFSEEKGCSAFLKRLRRIQMSEDAHEPAAVLMSDADLELSGEEALGASSREEVNLADEIVNLLNLLPGANEGKLKIQLSEQAVSAEGGSRPASGDSNPAQEAHDASTRLSKHTGVQTQGVSRSRYRRGGRPVATATQGGDS